VLRPAALSAAAQFTARLCHRHRPSVAPVQIIVSALFLSLPAVRVQQVAAVVSACLRDGRRSVRAEALEVVGRHVGASPRLAAQYAEQLLPALADEGVSVRKRAVAILRELLLSQALPAARPPSHWLHVHGSSGGEGDAEQGEGGGGLPADDLSEPVLLPQRSSLRARVLRALLQQAGDPREEEGVREAIADTFHALWLSPLAQATGAGVGAAPGPTPRRRAAAGGDAGSGPGVASPAAAPPSAAQRLELEGRACDLLACVQESLGDTSWLSDMLGRIAGGSGAGSGAGRGGSAQGVACALVRTCMAALLRLAERKGSLLALQLAAQGEGGADDAASAFGGSSGEAAQERGVALRVPPSPCAPPLASATASTARPGFSVAASPGAARGAAATGAGADAASSVSLLPLVNPHVALAVHEQETTVLLAALRAFAGALPASVAPHLPALAPHLKGDALLLAPAAAALQLQHVAAIFAAALPRAVGPHALPAPVAAEVLADVAAVLRQSPRASPEAERALAQLHRQQQQQAAARGAPSPAASPAAAALALPPLAVPGTPAAAAAVPGAGAAPVDPSTMLLAAHALRALCACVLRDGAPVAALAFMEALAWARDRQTQQQQAAAAAAAPAPAAGPAPAAARAAAAAAATAAAPAPGDSGDWVQALTLLPPAAATPAAAAAARRQAQQRHRAALVALHGLGLLFAHCDAAACLEEHSRRAAAGGAGADSGAAAAGSKAAPRAGTPSAARDSGASGQAAAVGQKRARGASAAVPASHAAKAAASTPGKASKAGLPARTPAGAAAKAAAGRGAAGAAALLPVVGADGFIDPRAQLAGRPGASSGSSSRRAGAPPAAKRPRRVSSLGGEGDEGGEAEWRSSDEEEEKEGEGEGALGDEVIEVAGSSAEEEQQQEEQEAAVNGGGKAAAAVELPPAALPGVVGAREWEERAYQLLAAAAQGALRKAATAHSAAAKKALAVAAELRAAGAGGGGGLPSSASSACSGGPPSVASASSAAGHGYAGSVSGGFGVGGVGEGAIASRAPSFAPFMDLLRSLERLALQALRGTALLFTAAPRLLAEEQHAAAAAAAGGGGPGAHPSSAARPQAARPSLFREALRHPLPSLREAALRGLLELLLAQEDRAEAAAAAPQPAREGEGAEEGGEEGEGEGEGEGHPATAAAGAAPAPASSSSLAALGRGSAAGRSSSGSGASASSLLTGTVQQLWPLVAAERLADAAPDDEGDLGLDPRSVAGRLLAAATRRLPVPPEAWLRADAAALRAAGALGGWAESACGGAAGTGGGGLRVRLAALHLLAAIVRQGAVPPTQCIAPLIAAATDECPELSGAATASLLHLAGRHRELVELHAPAGVLESYRYQVAVYGEASARSSGSGEGEGGQPLGSAASAHGSSRLRHAGGGSAVSVASAESAFGVRSEQGAGGPASAAPAAPTALLGRVYRDVLAAGSAKGRSAFLRSLIARALPDTAFASGLLRAPSAAGAGAGGAAAAAARGAPPPAAPPAPLDAHLSRYLCETAMLLPYTAEEEALTLVAYVNRAVGVHADEVAAALEEGAAAAPPAPQAATPQAGAAGWQVSVSLQGAFALQEGGGGGGAAGALPAAASVSPSAGVLAPPQLMHAAACAWALVYLLTAKRYLKRAYELRDARIRGFVPQGSGVGMGRGRGGAAAAAAAAALPVAAEAAADAAADADTAAGAAEGSSTAAKGAKGPGKGKGKGGDRSAACASSAASKAVSLSLSDDLFASGEGAELARLPPLPPSIAAALRHYAEAPARPSAAAAAAAAGAGAPRIREAPVVLRAELAATGDAMMSLLADPSLRDDMPTDALPALSAAASKAYSRAAAAASKRGRKAAADADASAAAAGADAPGAAAAGAKRRGRPSSRGAAAGGRGARGGRGAGKAAKRARKGKAERDGSDSEEGGWGEGEESDSDDDGGAARGAAATTRHQPRRSVAAAAASRSYADMDSQGQEPEAAAGESDAE